MLQMLGFTNPPLLLLLREEMLNGIGWEQLVETTRVRHDH